MRIPVVCYYNQINVFSKQHQLASMLFVYFLQEPEKYAPWVHSVSGKRTTLHSTQLINIQIQ